VGRSKEKQLHTDVTSVPVARAFPIRGARHHE
jgi:hypothetical protein